MARYLPCPDCSTPDPKKVKFTWWGGVVGPSILNHVECEECGAIYNGKTGGSNSLAIAVYVFVSGIVVIGALVVLAVLA